MGDLTVNETGEVATYESSVANVRNLLYSALTQDCLVDNSTDADIKHIPSTVKNEDDLYLKVQRLISEEIDSKQEVTSKGMKLQFSDSSCKEIKCEAADLQVKEENDIYTKLEPLISEEVSIKEEIVANAAMVNQDKFDNVINLIGDSLDKDIGLALFNVQKAENKNEHANILLSPFGNKANDSFGNKANDSFGNKANDSFGNKANDSFGNKANDLNFSGNKLQRHPKSSLYHCKLCSYSNKAPSKVLEHMRIHTREKPFACEECSYKTAYKAGLQDHFRNKHSGVKHLACLNCDFKTASRQNLRMHMQAHNKDKLFKCSLCPFQTKRYDGYHRHFKTLHDQGKLFKCNECDFEIGLKRDLLYHMKTHTGNNYLKCNECEYRTLTKSALRTHVKIHLTYKPFSCDKCDNKFTLKGNLVNHLLMHEKPFKCNDCHYSTGSRYFMKQHLKEHGHGSLDETFKCEQCNFTSSLKKVVQWHAKIHSGKKLYECDECEYKTDCSSNLKKHKALHDKKRSDGRHSVAPHV